VPYNGGFACTQCHDTKLWEAHTIPTTISLEATTAPRNKVCVGCHIDSVDPWGRPSNGKWALQAGGMKCTACHALAATHQTTSTAHDASAEIMSAPGSRYSATVTTATSVNETFGLTTTWPTAWTRTSTTLVSNSTTPPVGTTPATARILGQATRAANGYSFQRSVNLSAYSTARVTYRYITNTTTLTAGDFYGFAYSPDNGSTWTTPTVFTTGTPTWSLATVDVPVGAAIVFRFTAALTGSYRSVYYDDIIIEGFTTTLTEGTLAANSTAAQSCQNNPFGSECHVVSDVAALHSNVTTTIAGFGTLHDCQVCHRNNTYTPTDNCQGADCHAGMNLTVHRTTRHATAIGNTTLFTSAFVTGWCQGCHMVDLESEHTTLTAFKPRPCSQCHRRSYDSGAPLNVTKTNADTAVLKASGTALCVDCHTTISSTGTSLTIHAQRSGLSSTGTSMTGGWQFDLTGGASGHRLFPANAGMKTATFTAMAAGITWPAETAANYLKAGWTNTSMVKCNDCHLYSGSTGPHGANMTITIDPAYPAPYSAATVTNAAPYMGTTNICYKCHSFTGTSTRGWANHGGTHNGSHVTRCIACHTRVPHAWRRPRLIGYKTDPYPYNSLTIQGIKAPASGAQTNWANTSDCQASSGGGVTCSSHTTAPSPRWP
ncbi:MAG: cytochrome c3 family protein, partial [Coriobacteriia bacterium]|nr:cytochrome c3 family protein [Coriobacteriia bacterium]